VKKGFVFVPVAVVAAALLACGNGRDDNVPIPTKQLPKGTVAFRVPELDEIADSATRLSVLRGSAILEATRDSLPRNVGNRLRCVSCHFSGGTARNAMPWVGVYARFPQYRARDGKVDLLEDRINDCFVRSLNGRALKSESRAMHDIVAYMAFLSLGVPAGASVDGQGLPKLVEMAGDTIRGEIVFTSQCSRCHGAAGQGSGVAPPLWGRMSYNNGAGMSRIGVLASFAHKLMPLDKPGTLSPQQAYDVASYLNSRPRPDYPARADDFPNGDTPDDLGYPLARGARHISRR
jgi:thiosulfate dehydrogenase